MIAAEENPTELYTSAAGLMDAAGAEILGVDLSNDLDAAAFAPIQAALDEYGVIVLRDQTITPWCGPDAGRRQLPRLRPPTWPWRCSLSVS